MASTVRERLDSQAGLIVGREAERAILHGLLGEAGPLILFVHGIAGIGKSALVGAFAAEARAAGATVLHLDGGAIEPTQRGFLAALGGAVGGEVAETADAAARLRQLGDRVVLVLDTYELLRPLDPWLRQEFVPALSDSVRLVLAGREPPISGWRTRLGSLFRSLPLTNLGRAEAHLMLRRDGVPEEDAEQINRLARGHPLSLRLASSALLESPELGREAATVRAMIEELTELYLARLDPATRQALDAASVVRRPTLSLLGAMLPQSAPQDSFERLRGLPFVELGGDGLVLHDTVREVVAAFLRAADPERSRRYRVAAWRQLTDELTRAAAAEMWRYTADLLYILENPMIREAFFPTTTHHFFVDAAQPADAPAIAEIARQREPPASTEILDRWWQLFPGRFRVARDQAGAVAGFYVVAEMDQLAHGLVELDPIARRCRDHLRGRPVPRGQRVLLYRFEIIRGDSHAQPPVRAALVLDLKRLYMELRPQLRRIYTVDRELVTPVTPWAKLGFEPVSSSPIVLDDVAYYTAHLDFGPASVDGWLAGLIASELQIEQDSMLDLSQRQLVLDGRRVDLTRLEFELLHYLHQRPGRVVERSALLRDVWGYDHAGGSNVIEAVVRSVRRKLGDQAAAIETVRGRGYRFAAPR